jgi:hypothetical protein
MNDQIKQSATEKAGKTPRQTLPATAHGRVQDDDRYPGSFFRVPGLAVPGKTGWSLS